MIYINGRYLTQSLTGVQRFAYEISKELICLRHDVVFLVPDEKLNTVYDIDDFRIEVVKGGLGHFWEQITLPMFLKNKKRRLLINLCSTAPAFYKNQISTHHDITYVRFPRSFSFKFRLLYKYLIPKILNNSKKIITVSNFSKNEISNHYSISAEKIDVIYNAVGKQFLTQRDDVDYRSDDRGDFALAVSSPNYHKNFHGLIEAFLELNIDVKLKIIGSRSSSFNNVNYNYHENERVEFLGRVNDDELISLYKHAKFFVFPSLYEGFGIPPLEAQACGCPVISSSAASMTEILAESVLYFNPSSKEDIKKALVAIDSDDRLQEKIRNLGFCNVMRFSWKNSAIKINNLINELGDSNDHISCC
ncbi:glycosyltransferase family 1 protein [Klebsiella huaxiensis]|uniref:Glycosyltransferase family 1 protein n=1 Tax=Klebsiella huaxiensis TaxID=2153354 RepID=A0ABT6EFX9_9ENTR|nr:glycosyltransferase family 1 protein [Klebsiella huaxiensis]MDG1644316.1 glycosyltransferase family 1 protein [Klebsiella huaxiensis]QBG07464.1 glycosyltransferase family 1 protein [Klebsiella huaxiensis]VUS54921.1 N-acetylgalactosamine-N,N'-diacetylbacillosaminyl-diphospho-undecaprenol 4-alpha-N-acetylgalactosaminyltransferase [Klebsiella huaxiensis]